MAQRRKKRTSIRTAAATVQQQYLERIQALRADPTRVLPEVIGDEPKQLAKIRQAMTKMAAGKGGFLYKRDKGVIGAVANILDVADQEAVPRIIDHKVAGQRRFYLQRGQVQRTCSLGVQNHDDPRVLMLAYEPLAKENELHFFAANKLWCTGTTPDPPGEWIDAIAERTGIDLRRDGPTISCGHDGAAVLLGFREGPTVAVCGPCAAKTENLHGLISTRYMGPRRRQPLTLHTRAPDGSIHEVDRELAATYRGGVSDEKRLLAAANAQWRKATRDTGTRRFILGDTDHGDDQDAFLDALGPEPWERVALAAMTKDGHVSRHTQLAAVLGALKGDIPKGVEAILGEDPAQFLAGEHRKGRDLLRAAHEEQQRRAAVADLPDLPGLQKVGAWMDAQVRALRIHGETAAKARLRKETDAQLRGHAAALLCVLGDDPRQHSVFSADDADAGEARQTLAAAMLHATGDGYRQALATYLQDTGTGETVQ